jgi:serine/threonine protein phosphatase PrpC
MQISPLCGICSSPLSLIASQSVPCALCLAPMHVHCRAHTAAACACARLLRLSDVVAERAPHADDAHSHSSSSSSSSRSSRFSLLCRESRAALRSVPPPPPLHSSASLAVHQQAVRVAATAVTDDNDNDTDLIAPHLEKRLSERLSKRRKVAEDSTTRLLTSRFEIAFAAASLPSPQHVNQDCFVAPAPAPVLVPVPVPGLDIDAPPPPPPPPPPAVSSTFAAFPGTVPLFAVLDGHGAGGELSSQLAANVFAHEVAALSSATALASTTAGADADADAVALAHLVLSEAIAATNAALMAAAPESILKERGSTLCAAAVVGSHLVHAHVGDSRLLLLRGQRLTALTADHSAKRVDERARVRSAGGNVTVDGREHRLQHRLTGADGGTITATLGMTRGLGHVHFARVGVTALPDVGSVELKVGDRVLLCTDGVSDVVSSEALRRTLAAASSAADAMQLLCEAVAAGCDDRTLIVIDLCARPDDTKAPTTV